VKSILAKSGLAILCLAIGIQLWPAGRTNPPVTADIDAPPEVRGILRRSCYDCHSNETRWPWYGWIAPVSWFLVHDVNSARRELNFSGWGEYTERKRNNKTEAILDQIDEGHMPPSAYIRMHPDAKVSSEDLAILRGWVGGPVTR
jgi:hypothetical protein